MSPGVLVWGAVAATLVGAIAALESDVVIAVGERLLQPIHQPAWVRVAATAGLAGLLYSMACGLVAHGLGRVSTPPYADAAEVNYPVTGILMRNRLDSAGRASGYRGFAGAAAARTGPSETARSAMDGDGASTLDAGRYDSLYQDPGERRLLMDMLISGRLMQAGHTARLRSAVSGALIEFEIR